MRRRCEQQSLRISGILASRCKSVYAAVVVGARALRHEIVYKFVGVLCGVHVLGVCARARRCSLKRLYNFTSLPHTY